MEGFSEINSTPNNKIPKGLALEVKNCLKFSNETNLFSDYFMFRKTMMNNTSVYKNSKNCILKDLIKESMSFLLSIVNAKYNAYNILERMKLSDIVESYQVFENIEINKELNQLNLTHFSHISHIFEDKVINIHDSVLMDSYSFGRIMNDIMLILQYLPSRKDNGKFCAQFDSAVKPSISTKDYFARLSEFFLCSPSLFVLMFIYIKRIIENNPAYTFDSKSAHRLMLATLVISVKLYDDKLLPNAHYAHVGGVSESELSRLEVDALLLMDFRLKVTFEEFVYFSYSIRLLGEAIKKYGLSLED